MKRLYYGFMLGALTVSLASCSDDNPWLNSATEGGIAISVQTDSHVVDAMPTRTELQAPPVSDFTVRATKNDGSTVHECKVGEWDNSRGFSSGQYTFEAFYGDINEEGYDKPYFHGSTPITVSPGNQTQASVTARLANTMVSMAYTDAFKNYFTAYKTTLHSDGHGYIEVDPSNNEPVYLVPGNVDVTVEVTKPNGKSATIQPAEFAAAAQHHYRLTLDVNNGEVGDAQLVVVFDDTVEQEDVTIDLSDELFDVSAPEVSASGFTPGTPVEVLLTGGAAESPKFTIYAPGKMKAATLTIESENYHPSFGNEIEFISSSPSQQAALTAAGIKVLGLYKNPDKMATIEIGNLLPSLPVGTHKFTLVVKDALTRVNEPVTLEVNVSPVDLNIVSASPVAAGASTATLQIGYNGQNLQNEVVVEAKGDNGVYQKCEYVSVVAKARTRSQFPTTIYEVTVKVPFSSTDMPLRVLFNDTVYDTGTIDVFDPVYTLTSDAFAKKVNLYVNTEYAEHVATIVNNMRVFEGGSEVASSRISRNVSAGVVTVSGLSAATSYTLHTTTAKGSNPTMATSVSFTTESELQPENGSMEDWTSIKQYAGKTMGIGLSEILCWFPSTTSTNPYWQTRNLMTTSQTSGSTCAYTSWSGTVSATGVSGKAAEISTLGWGEGNTYTAVGGNIKNKSAGMLFMGDYAYDASSKTETITLGRAFASRPSSLSFDYKFAPYNGESFKAYVVIEHRDGGNVTELARKELVSGDAKTSFTTATLNLSYSSRLKATHAYVVFLSSSADSPEVQGVRGSAGAFAGYNDSKYVGCVLTVDNIRFNY